MVSYRFLNLHTKKPENDGWYCCPCVKCRNVNGKKIISDVKDHLICYGIDQSYTTWFFHGEPFSTSGVNNEVPTTSTTTASRMSDFVNDAFKQVNPEFLDACMNEVQEDSNAQDEDNINDDIYYKKLQEDVVQPLFPTCQNGQTKLSLIIELMSAKARHQWSDNSFTELLQILKKTFLEENSFPENTRTAKKLIKSLGMDYVSIHACRNDCILYWKEHSDRSHCPKCNESRWQTKYLKSRGSRVPWKVLRYFPLAPRLRRLYSVPWIAKEMKWHANSIVNDDYMRHPSDSSCWKLVNRKWPDFALEPRNVRLGLATDGFNPFGNMSNSYSCWPVMMVPYNLPPSYCMTKEFTMLTLLIPGKKSPGHNIDVYLRPLVEELNELWSIGCTTYDAYNNEKFTMKAILLWVMHDFPAYGHLSGCRTAGKYACPPCGEGIDSIRLIHGKKYVYMSNRRWLSSDHSFRSQKSQFNGEEEHRKHPKRLTGQEVLEKMENIPTTFGKTGKKRKRSTEDQTAWSKRSIFFDLPYWKELHIRHNLDVMHVEKNVAEILLATIMDTKDTSNKDGLAARQDLQERKIKRNLWPIENNGKLRLPKAPFVLSQEERKLICRTLYDLKVPIGYSINWEHHVNMDDFQFKGLKSHDYHILMQQLLPVLLMHAFKNQKPLRAAILQLSNFFNVLCSKVLHRQLLMVMKERVVETLCVFEKYFPPSFFVSMIHLVVHLAEEALVCGPVPFRWMYHFERMMRKYKAYVKNKAHPEGCIAERYLVEESIMYAMEYMPNGRKGNHKRTHETFMDGDEECIKEVRIDKKGKKYTLSNLQYEQVRRWILQQSPENAEWEEKYQLYLQGQASREQNRRRNMGTERPMGYIPWLRKQLQNEETSIFKRLADGPSFDAISYNTYAQNGYLFCTSESEKTKTTQNSGVSMQALTSFRASARDTNLVEDVVTYYGIIKQILALNYFDFKETVFLCDWVRIEDKINGCVVDPDTNLIFVNLRRFKSNLKENDEPFVRASEAAQVFYCKDPTRDNWHVVMEAPKRLTRDVDAFEDPLVFEARMKTDALVATLVSDIIEENVDDV